MTDTHPWYTRIGLLIFVVVPATYFYQKYAEPKLRHSAVAETKTTAPAPETKSRKRLVITENQEPDLKGAVTLYRAKEPPETIRWYAYSE